MGKPPLEIVAYFEQVVFPIPSEAEQVGSTSPKTNWARSHVSASPTAASPASWRSAPKRLLGAPMSMPHNAASTGKC